MALGPNNLATALRSAREKPLVDACEFIDNWLRDIDSTTRPFNIQIPLPIGIHGDAILLTMVRQAYMEVGWRTEMRDATTLEMTEETTQRRFDPLV